MKDNESGSVIKRVKVQYEYWSFIMRLSDILTKKWTLSEVLARASVTVLRGPFSLCLAFVVLLISGNNQFSQAPPETKSELYDVKVSCKASFGDPRYIDLSFSVKNIGKSNLFVTDDPIQLFGKRGYYLGLDSEDPSALNVSSILFPAPPFSPIVDKRSVLVKQILPGQDYEGKIRISFPVTETIPPFREGVVPRGNILRRDISKIGLSFGVFTDLAVQIFTGVRVRGDETISSGKTLLGLQVQVTSPTCGSIESRKQKTSTTNNQ